MCLAKTSTKYGTEYNCMLMHNSSSNANKLGIIVKVAFNDMILLDITI